MPRRPEIGNIQLYPSRPLRPSDRNGFILKFYCPIKRRRIRRNCGTRDRRTARRIVRECQKRLLNGQYVSSGGAITADHERRMPLRQIPVPGSHAGVPTTWEACSERYRQHRASRVRAKSLADALSRLSMAEQIFERYRSDRGLPSELVVSQCMTLDMLEHLQEQLLVGEASVLDRRSPNTVNSIMGAVMAFVRFCARHGWITETPAVEKLDVEEVMKGRPITGEEFERMLTATPAVVGQQSAPSWQFALHILWESGFRVSDLMRFSWDDDRQIHPVWSRRRAEHPTLVIPPQQKNRRVQQIPMLPGLEEHLGKVPKSQQTGWIANPLPIQYEIRYRAGFIRPTDHDLKSLAVRFNNRSIANICAVTETTVRKWLAATGFQRKRTPRSPAGTISSDELMAIKERAQRKRASTAQRSHQRLTTRHVSRVISMIGKEAGVVVRQQDTRTGHRRKFASAHDIRRGFAQRLINLGVSAETLKVVLRHRDFATTEKFYGAIRSAQSAAREVRGKLPPSCGSSALVGGLVGGHEKAPRLSTDELRKLKAVLNSL